VLWVLEPAKRWNRWAKSTHLRPIACLRKWFHAPKLAICGSIIEKFNIPHRTPFFGLRHSTIRKKNNCRLYVCTCQGVFCFFRTFYKFTAAYLMNSSLHYLRSWTPCKWVIYMYTVCVYILHCMWPATFFRSRVYFGTVVVDWSLWNFVNNFK